LHRERDHGLLPGAPTLTGTELIRWRSAAIGAVALTVRRKVKAYLVSPRELEARRSALGGTQSVRRPIRGTLEIVGDLAAGSRRAAKQLEQAARRSAHELRR
jgi:hypothetical protein